MSDLAPLSLFICYPFCPRKCAFCARPVTASPTPTRRRYADALIRELESSSKGAGDQAVSSVLLGGGLPSLADPRELTDIVACVKQNYVLAPDAEITLKVLPDPANRKRYKGWLDAGFNRLDYSMFTGEPFIQRLLGRLCPGAEIYPSEGFDNIAVDLMFGLPGQTPEIMVKNLAEAVSAGASHIALHVFALENDTPLGTLYANNPAYFSDFPRRRFPTSDQNEETLQKAREAMRFAGMSEYLPLRFALPGRESRFELDRFSGGDVLGFGCFAKSRFHGISFTNTEFVDTYIANSPDFDKITAEYSICE